MSATSTGRAVPRPARRRRRSTLVLYAVNGQRRTLSYQLGWPRAFRLDERFDATTANVMTRRGRLFARWALRTHAFDAVVVLHSVLSNEGVLFGPILDELAAHPAPKVYFVGNEYKLMPQKLEFSRKIDVSLLVTMMHQAEVHELYRQALGCAVVEIPSAGVDTDVFFPTRDLAARPIDLGMRAYDEPLHIGHQERRAIGTHFAERAAEYGLEVDVSFSEADRFTAPQYADFLNRCRGQLGTEAGGEFFQLSDELFVRVTEHVRAEPEVTLDELWPVYFAHEARVRARSITGRHAEAAATKTAQILFEGDYSGFFEPDVHYLALRKDFANVASVLDRFRDDDVCREIVDNAYAVALEQLAYPRLLDRLVAALDPLLPARPARRGRRR